MFKIVSVSVSPVEAGLYLTRIANNITSCVLSYGIIDFVFNETKGRNERKLFARLSYNPANPIIHEIYKDVESQIAYLEMLKGKFSKSITIDFLYKKATGEEDLAWFQNHIPEAKYKIEVAKLNQRKMEYEHASEIWNELIISNQATTPILETAIRNQYICFEQLQKFDHCIRLYVDSFFTNEFIVDKIETKNIQHKIRDKRFKVIPPSIDLPIFYTISSTDETEIHTAFEKFNLHEGVCKPSDLLTKFENYPSAKILFFLKYTCSPEILKHSIHINGSKERLEERLKILQFLKEKDTSDKRFYEDEIKNITNILIIQKGLLELDESKIYVNEQGIINSELKDFEAVYLSFKAFSKIAEKSKVWMLEKTGRLVTYNYTEEGYDKEKVEYSSNPVYDVYKDLFDVIKDKFLNSKFGIVAYLSTRIRHGVLIGELRPIFEKHKLITQKEGDTSTYRRNSFWENNLRQLPDVQRAKVQDCLNDFSYAIDGLIYDLIKKYLQVYNVNTNPDGWFDYDFEDKNLFWFSIKALKTRDFADFANDVFEILWERTDINLQSIRQKIQTEISQQFNEQFDTLERDVTSLLSSHHSQQFTKAVKDCSTETQNVIKRISSWFKRSGTATSDFQLDTLIDIVMEYCNKSHPHQKVNLQRQLDFNCIIKGEYYTHFADLFRIFFENILKHADEKTILVEARIMTYLEDDFLKVCIQNTITKKESIDALKTVWDEKTMNIAKLKDEGKSGYHKAYKILNSDLKNDKNCLETNVDDNDTVFTVLISIKITDLRK